MALVYFGVFHDVRIKMNNGLIRYRGDFALLDQVRHVDVRKGKEENVGMAESSHLRFVPHPFIFHFDCVRLTSTD